MKKILIIANMLMLFCGLTLQATELQAERIYLSGKDYSDAINWDFKCSKGRNCGKWTKIPVPSNWEQQGFGGYNYGHDDPATKFDETGTYRTKFFLPKEWKNTKHVRLVFEGAMTETSIKINGKPVGATNFGGYIPFHFILDKYSAKFGQENELEVLVKKKPTNHSLDMGERKADYWVFGGIYRPVFLEVQAKEFVDRVAIDAKADGSFNMDVFPQVQRFTQFKRETINYVDQVTAQIETLSGTKVGKPFSAEIIGATGRVQLNTKINKPKLWSPEHPNLYQVRVSMLRDGQAISEKVERFGFRTVDVRVRDGIYLNGQKLLIQGINRNVFHPKHGRVVSKQDVWQTARDIKAMNANLVRSHLPPTPEFMQACDELGLLVITELTNWHDPVIDSPIAREIAFKIVARYQNHPSVILWANGNENGFNLEVDQMYHLYDKQDRHVIHPWSLFEGIDTLHYPKWDELVNKLKGPNIYLPTEFLHGLYDGGHGASMADYWKAIHQSPIGAGGVLWCWADAAIERTDMGGRLDTYGNRSADGLVGPYGEKEASYFTVREIWSPIQITEKTLNSDFNGTLTVENRYQETSLNAVTFKWQLLQYTQAQYSQVQYPQARQHKEQYKTSLLAQGELKGSAIAPGQTGKLSLPINKQLPRAHGLKLVAYSASGREIMSWTWDLGNYQIDNDQISHSNKKVSLKQLDDYVVQLGNSTWSFSEKTGLLQSVSVNGKDIGFGNGPLLYAGKPRKPSSILTKTRAEDDAKQDKDLPIIFNHNWRTKLVKKSNVIVITSNSKTDESSFSWTLNNNGKVTLDYHFVPIKQKIMYSAVGFNLAEDQVTNKQWLGRGPFRTWANRVEGMQFGLWQSQYNDYLSGENWGTPEFKGIFDQVRWMLFGLKNGSSLKLEKPTRDTIGVMQPRNVEGLRGKQQKFGPAHTWWHYPEQAGNGGLFIFHKIPPMGNKFGPQDRIGPQSLPVMSDKPIKGQVTFSVM
ncbi:glycoside hydrolase family 2 TIM barrel-domain containing protein [Saccharobesus litoralis]|nr:glycoside hydrolase family 2 TIM barrel-domain containing protein [Saccharobesus litoralis]